MCGIAGIIAPQPKRFRPQVENMLDALAHRGPDGEGIAFFDTCVLGHRRLKIIDLETGGQPMFGPDETTAVVFNGEIYGYQNLRNDLADYPFRTSSDTEVILALYRRGGSEALTRLPGMFAFALWDDRRHELLCMRDRFGEKPFYYAFGDNGEFIFASEIKGITASGLVKPEIDAASLEHYLNYLYVPPNRTIYKNVHVLPPAHRLVYRDGRVAVSPYWQLPVPTSCLRADEAVERFRFLLHQAVKRQLVADVPVGVLLSGGLDSSTVAALASQHSSGLQTFSFGFRDGVNELPYAREVAAACGTRHTELMDEHEDIAALLVRMQSVYDEPFADSSAIPTYLLAGLCRRNVKVALSGDGADELLAGYSFWYRSLHNMRKTQSLPGALGNCLVAAMQLWRKTGLPLSESATGFHDGLALNRRYTGIREAHAARTRYFTDPELEQLGLRPHADREALGRSNDIDAVLRRDTTHYLPGDILVKTDRASMAHGLELRSPFLDWEFAEFCLSLPLALKINSREDKVILRRAFEESWPTAVRKRGKQGFGAPVSRWLKHDSVLELTAECLQRRNHEIFSSISFDGVQAMTQTSGYKTWILLVLALWMAESSRTTQGQLCAKNC
ncbi:MAG: asparagine synthase (glutamine-hydrolyzing) [Candidatus Omnitrophota bacterium]|nr:asparagine synthase (glutamine-hydrolyzing) [Candidatus Omnitrophota bacterium]